jgi:hypothetical protein
MSKITFGDCHSRYRSFAMTGSHFSLLTSHVSRLMSHISHLTSHFSLLTQTKNPKPLPAPGSLNQSNFFPVT